MKLTLVFIVIGIPIVVGMMILFFFISYGDYLLESNDHLFSNGKKVDPEVSELIKKAPSAESFPDADVIYILDESVEEIFSDGRYKETVHMVYKIVSEEGKDYGDCEIGYDSRTEEIHLLHARSISPDGEILPVRKNALEVVTPYSDFPEYSDYQELVFSLPGIEIGSIIDYKYAKEVEPTIKGVFASRFFFQSYNPIFLSRYKLIVPQDMNVNHLFINPSKYTNSSPITSFKSGRKIYSWESRNSPQILDEEFMPPLEEVAPNVLVTNMDSWDQFFQWWQNEIERKIKVDQAMTQKVEELTKNVEGFDEKVKALFDYVKREIRYVYVDLGTSGYTPASANEIFTNKYGDCKDQSTLLISMLKAAGIPAYYVLIPTRNMGDLIKDFPYPWQFDHCIVAVDRGDSYHYLDPTAEDYCFDYLPGGNQDRGVVIFKDDNPIFAKTPLAEPKKNAFLTQHRLQIKSDGSMKAEVEYKSVGSTEAYMRSIFIDSNPTETRELFEKTIYKFSPGANLLDYSHSNPLDFNNRFTTTFKYRVDDYCNKAGNLLIFQLPVQFGSCLTAEKEMRRYPIFHNSLYSSNDVVEFNIPKGYEVYHLPERVDLKNPFFEFHSSYELQGTSVLYQEEFLENAVKIAAEDYAYYRQSCQKADKSRERYVVFRKNNQ